MTIPAAEQTYLAVVVDRLRQLLGTSLVGVYPTGSLALDGYQPGRSDLDLIVVAAEPAPADLRAVATGLAHQALPCPAAGLELVLYDQATLAGLGNGPGFALNLNTGRELPAKTEFGPGAGPQFWYPIDRDIAHQQGRSLAGPAFAELVSRQPYAALRPVVAESVALHLDAVAEHGDNAVLNACRALRFRTEGVWSAKPAAARWAATYTPEFAPVIVAAADSHRQDRAAGRRVAAGPAADFLRYVLRRLES